MLGDSENQRIKEGECRLPDGYFSVSGSVIIVEKVDPYEEFIDWIKRCVEKRDNSRQAEASQD